MSVKYKLAIFGSNIYDMSDKYQFYPVECTVKKLFLILIKFSKFKKKNIIEIILRSSSFDPNI